MASIKIQSGRIILFNLFPVGGRVGRWGVWRILRGMRGIYCFVFVIMLVCVLSFHGLVEERFGLLIFCSFDVFCCVSVGDFRFGVFMRILGERFCEILVYS